MRAARRFAALELMAPAIVLAMAFLVIFVMPARADTPISAFSATPGNVVAGGHPDVEIYFEVENRVLQHSQSACNCEDVKDATVHFPPGFIGNPHATPQCSVAEFSANECPIDSQVGIVNVFATNGIAFNSAVYNLIPPPDDAGLLGFKIFFLGVPQFTVLSARTGSDYGLDAAATSIYHGAFPLQSYQQDIWGIPADPIHDPLRLNPEENPQGKGETAYSDNLCDEFGAESSTSDPNTIRKPCTQKLPPEPSHSPLIPFLQDPTNCDSVRSSQLEVLSYDGGVTTAEDTWPQMIGCDQLAFNPSLYAQPTTTEADSASGMEVNLSVPQELSPTIPSPTELRSATVTLPEGFSINSNAADGKVACSDAEARFGTQEEGRCPESAKIGSLTIDSSALPGPLPGFVYLGAPLPGDKYRIFLLANGFATHVKLVGTANPDPRTGQLTITFKELPQSPLTVFNLHIFGSERGSLGTPTRCGTYPVSSAFTPWDSSLPVITSTQYFTIDSGPEGAPCPGSTRPFSPSFEAGSASHTPGAHAPFAVEVRRPNGDQNLTGLTVSTPPGFTAKLKGVPYCPQSAIDRLSNPLYSGFAELALSACPPASQVGTAIASAGAGTHPVYVPGKVYLAGPYKGAPLSLLAVIPAVSGPYDLGNVAVRAAIEVDRLTAQVTAVSDPLPQIIEGIPLRTRSIRIDLDRPNFTLNPTNCDGFSVKAKIAGSEGAIAEPAAHFQVANCGTLPFSPKLALRFAGGTRRAKDPALHATLSADPGQANIARVVVVLPHSEFLDNAHIKGPCTAVQFAAEDCPAGSVIGHAIAESPLLEKPLEGPVLIRSSVHRLPDLVIALRGQVRVDLVAKVSSVHERLRASFRALPDVPISRVRLDLLGGQRGLLENSENLCQEPQRARVRLGGQNDKVHIVSVPVGAECQQGHARQR
jgi:hypothetical protein